MVYSQKTDEKWQKRWTDTGLYKFDESRFDNNDENRLDNNDESRFDNNDESRFDNKLYVLEMFSYPSGRNLHIGHWWNYSLPDSWSRMKRMQGYNIFHPVGFDAFGLPAENYAIKTGIHPMDSTKSNIETMEQQFRMLGATYDWNYEINTCVPEYYKWTQWLFLKLYENNLAYRKEAPVNWCPKCMTVLANEQAADGICERCETEVIRKNMIQWFFKITDYADELLHGLKELDWPEKTKRIQENWIGKSEGAIISFPVVGSDNQIDVFTTRIDTIMGASYVVLAPEHPLVDEVTTSENREEIDKYKLFSAKQTEIERLSTVKKKTGAFTGRYVRHPFNESEIPVWISDYVIGSYGTGAVMAVPAHDERDFEFAMIYSLPIIKVIEDGILINSGEFTDLNSNVAKERMVTKLENIGLGRRKTSYRLRDWLVSRQRYWGAPIPVVHCEYCGIVPIPESKLPVVLPYDVAFKPTGESPLATCEEFVKTDCPKCGKPAKRDTDTLDTFVCSSWYYLRFFDNTNDKEPFNSERANKIMPVDKYIGGVEHAAMHLLYARFVTKALHDMGYIDFDEPFKSLIHQGTILASDGLKMSKSKPNAISPDNYISAHGSDVFRVYLGFGFSYSDGGPWSDDGIRAIARFFSRLERIVERCVETLSLGDCKEYNQDGDLEYARHYAIKHATEDIENFQFNTAIARIMEYTNTLAKYQSSTDRCPTYESEAVADLLLIIAPFAPHFCEEMWEVMEREYSIFNQKWPVYDEAKLLKDSIEVAVQINGVVRDRIFIEQDMNDDELKRLIIASQNVLECINSRTVKRIIVVKNRIVNIVC